MSDVPALSSRLSIPARALLFALPVLLLVAVLVGGLVVTILLNAPPAPKTPLAHAGTDPDGGELFNFHCARCHGVNGDGNGPTPMYPKARHFGYERIKFTDTLTGVRKPNGDPVPQGAAGTLGGIPTDAVLIALLKRGIAGSPMPAFDHLSDAELQAVVGYLRARFLKPDRLVTARDDVAMRKEMASAKEEGEDFDPKKDWPPQNPAKRKKWEADWQGWFAEAVADATTSTRLTLPSPFPPPTPGFEERAAKLFMSNGRGGCAGCHGDRGQGTPFDPKNPRLNDNGTRALPRNFTEGVFRGGSQPEQIYSRIYLGIPGTPMWAFGLEQPDVNRRLTQAEIIDLVYYVQKFASAPSATETPAKQ